MEGFTVSNANRFLDTGNIRDSKSLSVEGPSSISSTSDTGKSFADTLKDAVSSVNELQKSSDTFAQNVATGKTDDVAGAMIAAERADIALRVMVQVRNKIIDAYSEVMKMQV
ncbi:flagellar hook-basal body complex protein FliE [Bdellovibrio svalbardensis]|uniref:Flagellar hook-basal body complex protein FliE n=1 Tax=Bdellovibrio svalbardensis TaxID=2972972 RepID=A0ABT6DET9_9BACT|nr:flagellar hook-basal body complex protein FliE [Bdellovibrio svalbardensis]MDG0815355.1 flagellar hook-basal body complex protein FliE [Bdellovibrio svalbardensis]